MKSRTAHTQSDLKVAIVANYENRVLAVRIGHFELPFASVSKRVLVRNHSNENEFDLQDNELVSKTHYHMYGFAPGLVLKPRQKTTRKCHGREERFLKSVFKKLNTKT